MLWTQPAKGRFDFSVTDRIADLAQAQGKKVRGHALIDAAGPRVGLRAPRRADRRRRAGDAHRRGRQLPDARRAEGGYGAVRLAWSARRGRRAGRAATDQRRSRPRAARRLRHGRPSVSGVDELHRRHRLGPDRRHSWRGAAQMATMFTEGFTQKNAYDRVRCRLAEPKPAAAPERPAAGPDQGSVHPGNLRP